MQYLQSYPLLATLKIPATMPTLFDNAACTFFTFILGFGRDLSFSCIFFAFLAFGNVILVAFHHLSYGFCMFLIFYYLYFILILQCNSHFTNLASQRQPVNVTKVWRQPSGYFSHFIKISGFSRLGCLGCTDLQAKIFAGIRLQYIEFTGLQLFSVF